MAASAEIFLLVVIVIIAFILLGALILLLIVYGHPDDANQAKLPKVITILGLFMSFAALLAMPYDVAATNIGGDNLIRMDILWQIIYILIAVFIAFIVPFAFFFYESDEDETTQHESALDTQWGQALKYTLALAAVLIIVLVILFSVVPGAEIPVNRMVQTVTANSTSNTTFASLLTDIKYLPNFKLDINGKACPFPFCLSKRIKWYIDVTFPIYLVGFFSFVGWWFFVLFAGTGFIALPWDLIVEFTKRPEPISAKVFVEEKEKLGQRCIQLIDLGNKMLREHEKGGKGFFARRGDANEVSLFEKNYFYLKKDYQILMIAYKLKGGNPLYYLMKFIMGICAAIISACWIIHIILFMLWDPNYAIHPFLNDFFIKLEQAIPGFPLFGVVAFAIFSFYLLCAVIAGNFRFGVRFLFWKIYPMEIGNTLMNAFLFNTWFILITSIPATQFCVSAFPIYTANTQIELIFGSQVKYLKAFRVFYANNVFIIMMLVIITLALLFMSFAARNRASEVEMQLDRIAKSSSTTTNYKDLSLDVDLKV